MHIVESGNDFIEAPAWVTTSFQQCFMPLRIFPSVFVDPAIWREAQFVGFLTNEMHDYRIARGISSLSNTERQSERPVVPNKSLCQPCAGNKVVRGAVLTIVRESTQKSELVRVGF
jgi:hypothetical protein